VKHIQDINWDIEFEKSFQALESYVRGEGYKGWDPYDGLNSKIFQKTPLLSSSKFFRLAWIQLFKRSPINFRKLLLVKKDFNSKGIALFLTASCRLYKIDQSKKYYNDIIYFAEILLNLVTKGWSGDCWGYNFDWQARAFYQPKYTPTVVASVYAASALSEAYEITGDQRYLNSVISCGNFVLKDLNRTFDKDGDFCFSYSPLDKSRVYNACLLGAKLLGIIYKYTGENEYKKIARRAINYCVKKQKSDGSWVYGEQKFHQWVDNFHTGFNLECISSYQQSTGDISFNSNLEMGFKYYISTFFLQNGMSKYYNNKTYPIDIHSPAQLVATLYQLNCFYQNKPLCDKVLQWTIVNMQDRKGFFYYQYKKGISSRIPYMRWAQAWMYNAFATYKLLSYED
jgi:rhamnogalacturonyl hydrolase YesR